MISDGVYGSALQYTISYSDSNTGDVCDTLIISASSCVQGICTVPSISPLPCSERPGPGERNIDIRISATNQLGAGAPSYTTIGKINTGNIIIYKCMVIVARLSSYYIHD